MTAKVRRPGPGRRAPLILVLLLVLGMGLFIANAIGGHPGPVIPSPTPGVAAPRIAGHLRSAGTDLVDERGDRIVLQGVNDGRMSSGAGNLPYGVCRVRWSSIPGSEIENIAAWGFNSVRLGVTWANLEPELPTVAQDGTVDHRYNSKYLSALDVAIAGFGARGIAVVLDMHQFNWSPAFPPPHSCAAEGMPVWLYVQDLNGDGFDDVPPIVSPMCDFFADVAEPGVPVTPLDGFEQVWRMLAGRYRGNPTVVGAEILNEPYLSVRRCSDRNLNPFFDRLGPAINAVNPEVFIAFSKAINDDTPPPELGSNWVFTPHVYVSSWERQGRPALQQAIARRSAWAVPLWVGEFNHTLAQPLGTGPALLAAEVEFMRQNDVGWSYWEYDRRSLGRLAEPDGTQDDSAREVVSILQTGFGLAH